MLVLQRCLNESIWIGNDIRITIVRVRKGGRVHLGIEAPKELSVHREEVYKRICEEKIKEEIENDA